ncbi:MAG: hypothetical protein WBD53_19560 [Xanthobacteraceae bacterium]
MADGDTRAIRGRLLTFLRAPDGLNDSGSYRYIPDGMAHRMEVARGLEDELFVLVTMGDDRAVRQTYIAGRPALRGHA